MVLILYPGLYPGLLEITRH